MGDGPKKNNSKHGSKPQQLPFAFHDWHGSESAAVLIMSLEVELETPS